MEQLKNENVSVKSDSLNRGCIEKIKGCYTFGCDDVPIIRSCNECKAGFCPDFFVCALDVPDSVWIPHYIDLSKGFAILRDNPERFPFLGKEVSHE